MEHYTIDSKRFLHPFADNLIHPVTYLHNNLII